MFKLVIADASCLIGLAKIGQLELLPQLFGKIIIPYAVYHEVVERGAGRKGATEIKEATWIEVQHVQNQVAVSALRMLMLGAGEAEAITLAAEDEPEFIILDDGKARQIALEMSLPVIGTVAVLAKAVEKGLVSDLKPLLEALHQAGFRFPRHFD